MAIYCGKDRIIPKLLCAILCAQQWEELQWQRRSDGHLPGWGVAL